MEQVCPPQCSALVASRTVRQEFSVVLSHPFCGTLLWQLQKTTILTIGSSSLVNILCDILLISISDSSYFSFVFDLLFDVAECGVLFSNVYAGTYNWDGLGTAITFLFFSYVV